MNRLVLIGNGFDLAHGLKTSYKDFICWYWYKWGEKLLSSPNKKESDELCSFTLNESIELAGWYLVWKSKYNHQKKNPLEPFNPIEIVGTAMSDRDLCEFAFISPLLQRIWKQFVLGWVDIENEYYSLLFQQKISQHGDIIMPDCRLINLQLDYLQMKLIQYLELESKKETPKIEEIREKIYRPIKEREISVSYKGSVDKSFLKEEEPSAIMLLNFNYTKTPEQYVTDSSTVKINYIHGKLDNPKSIIFGYGDESERGFNTLSCQDEKECLQHIKSIRYLETANYRRLMEFVESELFQIIIMGHSCGTSDGTLLNTLFEHRNCISIVPYYYYDKKNKEDHHLELIQSISHNFKDKKLMRDRVVNKEFCEPLT